MYVVRNKQTGKYCTRGKNKDAYNLQDAELCKSVGGAKMKFGKYVRNPKAFSEEIDKYGFKRKIDNQPFSHCELDEDIYEILEVEISLKKGG